jgi:hypothetical protein
MFFENQELKWSERVTKLRFLGIWQKSPILVKQAYCCKLRQES